MEFNFGDLTIILPSLPITMIAIIIIVLLVRWSEQLETRRFTVFVYFLISAHITPIYTSSTNEGSFQLWLPIGFIIAFLYLKGSKRNHPS